MESSLAALMALAATVGVVHTLAGPDHYVPLMAAAELRGWRARRTLVVTALLGVAHCAASLVIAGLAIATLGGLEQWQALQVLRGDLVAWLLVGLGLTVALLWWRGRRTAAPVAAGWLAVVFVLGPCEWLIPAAVGASAEHGILGAALVAAVFTLCTTLAMVAAVAVGLGVVRRTGWRLDAGPVAAAAIALCGVAILLGL